MFLNIENIQHKERNIIIFNNLYRCTSLDKIEILMENSTIARKIKYRTTVNYRNINRRLFLLTNRYIRYNSHALSFITRNNYYIRVDKTFDAVFPIPALIPFFSMNYWRIKINLFLKKWKTSHHSSCYISSKGYRRPIPKGMREATAVAFVMNISICFYDDWRGLLRCGKSDVILIMFLRIATSIPSATSFLISLKAAAFYVN